MSATPSPPLPEPDRPDRPDDAAPRPAAAPGAAPEAVAAELVAAGSAANAAPSAEPVKSTAPRLSPEACALELRKRFPALFGGAPKPVKLRIHLDIHARAPGVFTKPALTAFFRRHMGSTAYLIALSKARQRFDLDGQPCDELSEEHRQAALVELERRRNLHQARRQKEEDERRNRATLLRDYEATKLTPANFCALKGLTPEVLEEILNVARQERSEPPRFVAPQDRRDLAPRRDGPHEGPRNPPRLRR